MANTDLPPPPPGFQLIPPPPLGFQVVGAPPAEEPSFWDEALGYGQTALEGGAYLAQQATRGVANTLGAPVDLINASPMLLNLLPGEQGMRPFTDNPVGGSENIYGAMTLPRAAAGGVAGIEGDQQTDSAGLRIAGRVAEELGATAVPLAALAGQGARVGIQGARAVQEGGNAVQRGLGTMLESAAVDPFKFATRELAASAAAGGGAGLAREVVSDGDPTTTTTGEALADIGGALAGTSVAAGGGFALRRAADTARAVTGRGGQTFVRDAAMGELASRAGAPVAPSGAYDTSGLAEVLAKRERVSDVIPGYQDTSADVLKSPGVAALEYGRASGPNAGTYAQRRASNANAANDAVDALAPAATPGAYSAAAGAERDTLLRQAEVQEYLARTAFEDAAAKLKPVQSGEARGATVRGAMETALKTAREYESAAWGRALGSDPVDVAPLADAFDAVTAGLRGAERATFKGDAASVTGLPRSWVPEPEEGADGIMAALDAPAEVPMDEVTALRSVLTDEIRKANAAGDANQVRILNKYVAAVDGYLDGIPDLAEPLAEARAVSRDLNDRFTRRGTPVADTLATRPSGGPAVPDSNVTPQFIRPDEGQASNIDRVLKESGDNAETVRAALQDQIKADTAGMLDSPDRLAAYLKQYDAVFAKFPELRTDLGTAAGLKRNAEGAGKAMAETNRAFGPQGVSTVARYLKFGDERAADAMAQVANAKDPGQAIDELLTFVGDDPAAVDGARAAFWQMVKGRSQSTARSRRGPDGQRPWDHGAFYNTVTDPKNRAVLDRLYRDEPEHLANIDRVAESLQSADFSATGKVPGSSGTAQALASGSILPSAETLSSRAFAVQRGVVGVPFTGLTLGAVMLRRAVLKGRTKEFDELLDKALLEPDFMATLAKENNPANIAAMNRMAKIHLGVRTGWLDDLSDDEDEDADLMQAIGGGTP